MENFENILLGRFVEYKKFIGTIEISNGKYCGHIENTKDIITYNANTIEEMFEEYKKVIDTYISTKKEQVTCNDFLTSDCTFSCHNCRCRFCEKRTVCSYNYIPMYCGI